VHFADRRHCHYWPNKFLFLLHVWRCVTLGAKRTTSAIQTKPHPSRPTYDRARASGAAASTDPFDVQDGSNDRQWLQRFQWSDQLKQLNQRFFGQFSFRWEVPTSKKVASVRLLNKLGDC
jgi:hypothetical protein